jgi:uncharacterized protein YkwD
MPALGKIPSLPRMPWVRRIRVGGLALALALAALVMGSSPAYAWAAGSFSPDDEALLITLTNQDRASAGLPALTNDSYLHKEAEWRSKDMADRNYFSHSIPPSGTKVFDDMSKDHYCFKVAGENIGLSTYSDSAATARIERAFMGSASHRANIMGNWTRIGVGAYKAADGRKIYTVLFSLPCGSSSKAKATPKPVAKKTAAPTPSPTPTPTPTPTPAPTATPTPTRAPTATPTATPQPEATNPAGTSLRVREKAPPSDPFDSLWQMLFGLFG